MDAEPRRPPTRKSVLQEYPDLHRRYRSARTMAIVGGVAAGVGTLVLLSGLARVLSPNGADLDGRGFVTLGIGALIAAPGIAAMSVGLVRRKHILREVDDIRQQPRVAALPWLTPKSGGISATVVF